MYKYGVWFSNAIAFNNNDQPLNWNTSNVTDMNGMFKCRKL